MEHHGNPIGDFGEFVEVLARHQHGGAARGEIEQGLPNDGGSTSVDAPGRLADHKHGRVTENFAADDELLQVAAGQACRFGIALCLAHIERLGGAVDRRQGRGGVDETMPDHCAGRMAGQQGVFGKLHARRGAVTQAFFGHESRAKLAALGDGKMSRGMTVDDHGTGILG